MGGPQLGPPGSLLSVQWTVRCGAGTPATGELPAETGCAALHCFLFVTTLLRVCVCVAQLMNSGQHSAQLSLISLIASPL